MRAPPKLAASQIERRFAKLRRIAAESHVRPGWIEFLRRALGMSIRDIARHTGLSFATIAKMEKREQEGTITIASLRKIADAVDCDVIYALVPRRPVEEILRDRARAKATAIIQAADVHMSLEDQRVRRSLKSRIEELAEQLIDDGKVW